MLSIMRAPEKTPCTPLPTPIFSLCTITFPRSTIVVGIPIKMQYVLSYIQCCPKTLRDSAIASFLVVRSGLRYGNVFASEVAIAYSPLAVLHGGTSI